MKDFRRLGVWQRAHRLALATYDATREFPKDETYGLTRQLRSAAASIPTNIAEGCGRKQGDFARFLDIAMGSARELDYLLLLCRDLGLLTGTAHDDLNARTDEVRRMLHGLAERVSLDRHRARD